MVTCVTDAESLGVLLIRNHAESDGYRVEFEGGSSSGEGPLHARLSALEPILSRRKPEVIVLDLEFPIRDGVELLRVLTAFCPGAEILTRIRSRHLDPRFFAIRPSSRGLSLEPLGAYEQERLSGAFGQTELASETLSAPQNGFTGRGKAKTAITRASEVPATG